EIGVARKSSFVGFGLGPVHLESVNCQGDETALLQCRYKELLANDCSHGSEAEVVCAPPEGSAVPVRLVGGKEDYEGRVEVYHDGKWGTICDDQWNDLNAEVICRQLGLRFLILKYGVAKAWPWAHFGQGSGPILLDEVECTGNELSLDECQKNNWGNHNCDHIEDAGVSCNPFTGESIRGSPTAETNVALMTAEEKQQKKAREQRLSHCLNGRPGNLTPQFPLWLATPPRCLARTSTFFFFSYSFSKQSRSKGGARGAAHRKGRAQTVHHPVNLKYRLSLNMEIAFMFGNSTKQHFKLRILRLVIILISYDLWRNNDYFLCQKLIYGGPAKARMMAYFGEGKGPIHLDNVKCSGSENLLEECVKRDNGTHNCWHSEDAGVICDYKKVINTVNTNSLKKICGLRLMRHRKKRIIGGNKSIRGGWPWQVSLRLKTVNKDSRLLCGATIVSSCWVITAAHCFKRFGMDVRYYVLRIGDYHTAVEDQYEREIPVEKIVLHKNYRPNSNDNDIALVRLRGRDGHCITFNHHVLPVCLPKRKERARINRQACFITGWGDTGKSYSRTLLQGAVPLLPKEVCQARYKEKFTNRMICAGNLSEHKRVDSCQGDSGGPLMCQKSNGHWVILGVTSWGYGCGRKDSPGVYTKVARFLSWIEKVTEL
uniref:Serine protease 12 n=1 Tax=Latimeria chalumnae TaxID=7897 RepID=H2ZTM1_LATCH